MNTTAVNAAEIRRLLLEWPAYGARGDVESAIKDYQRLLSRNKSCEENITRLENINIKLRKEKVDLVKEISDIKQDAHQDILKAEARQQQKIIGLEVHNKDLAGQLAEQTKAYKEAISELTSVQEQNRQDADTIQQLTEERAQLQHDLEDTREALSCETDARRAATEELDARLQAKEKAEEEKERAEGEFRELKKNYLSKVDELAKAQDRANAEFDKYKEMQRMLELEKITWEEQHKGARFNPAASFNFGSVVGSVRNVLGRVAQAQSAQPSQQGEGTSGGGEGASEGLVAAFDEGEPYCPPVSPHPAAMLRRHEKKHSGGCNSIAFSPSGLHCATCGQDGVVALWSTEDGALSTELKPTHAQSAAGLNSVQFSEEKGSVMGASNDKSIKIWDLATGRLRLTMTGHTKAVLSIKQHPTLHSMAVSCGEDRVVKVWSLNEGICTRSIACRSKPMDVAFTRDGQCIVSAHFDGSLHVFDASTGSEMKVVEAAHKREWGACVAVVPTAMPFRMASVGRDSAVCLTDIYQGEVVQRFEHPALLSIGTQRCTPAVAPDDSVVAVGSSSGLLLLLNMATGQVEAKLSCHTSPISGVAWNTNPDFCPVVAGSVDRRGDVVFWRAEVDQKR